MPRVEIEEDVYRYLCSQTQAIGESASSILRRLLGLVPGTTSAPLGPPITPLISANEITVAESPSHSTGPSPDAGGGVSFVPGLDLLGRRTAIARFLAILSWLHDRHRGEFARVLEVGGDQRAYFGRTREAIEATGTSVKPQQIPNSDFWVTTNNDTARKCKIVREVADLFGYPQEFVKTLGKAVEPASAMAGIPAETLVPRPDHEPWKI